MPYYFDINYTIANFYAPIDNSYQLASTALTNCISILQYFLISLS